YLSFHLDTSTGGMIVVCQAVVFALVYLGAPEQGLIARAVRRRGLAAGRANTGLVGSAGQPPS
ncbi:hypothetical protein OU415_30525, partial [Saccharopolyspora sp. WRP15-2]|nr:hypothetical protein [Saccharopolyspora oryzae]